MTAKAGASPPSAWQRGAVTSWLVTANQRRLGVMYIVLGGLFLVGAGVLAILMRTQLIAPDMSFVTGNAYAGLVTMHGTAMVFFVVVPLVLGLATAIVPLQIGARSLAYPGLNAVAFWLFAFAALTFGLSALASGGAARSGWTAYPPISLLQPKNGQDFVLIALVLVAVSLFLTAANLLVTIRSRRAAGMTWDNTPIFARSVGVYVTVALVVTPIWIAGLVLLLLAREWPGSFDFLVTGPADDPVLRTGSFWLFGHPVAYLTLIPVLGIVAELMSVFSRRGLDRARLLTPSLAAVGGLVLLTWLHHTYSVGLAKKPAVFLLVLSLFVLAPAAVALWTLVGAARRAVGDGRVSMPALYAFGASVLFGIGALSGLFLAIWGSSRELRGTAFVVGHAHFILWGPTFFALIGALVYWWPKLFGRMLEERLTALGFWLLYGGFTATFLLHFFAGDAGMARRSAGYADEHGLATYNLIATLGSYVAGFGVLLLVAAALRSLNGRRAGNDPWQADTLEWLTSSPPPEHSFDAVPPVTSPRPLHDLRTRLEERGAL